MPNKDYAQDGMKQGRSSKPAGNKRPATGEKMSPPSPEKTANWPGVPGATQPGSRANGAPTTGKRGPFYVKKTGL